MLLKNFSDGTELETYEFKWRMHDPRYFFLFACNSNNEKQSRAIDSAQVNPTGHKVAVNNSDLNTVELKRKNGLKILDSLYEGAHRVKEELIDGFSFVHSINKNDSIITLNCIAKYKDDEWGYTLKLRD